MNHSLRLRLPSAAAAAAALLLPLAAAVLPGHASAQPAPYPPAAVAPQAGIERFVLRSPDGFHPGAELRFRVVGTPGGRAWLDIPGVVRGMPMTETRPGVYEARHVLRRHEDFNAFAQASATLRANGARVTAVVDVRESGWSRQARDERPPRIRDVSPDEGERVGAYGPVRIAAHFEDEGSGVAPDGVRLRVDGRDLTGLARVDNDGIRVRADLPPGRHTADLVVRDRAGNTTRRSWTFAVWGDHHDHDHGDRPVSWDRGDQPTRW